MLHGELKSLGKADAVEVGFEYRRRKQTEEMLDADAPWKTTPLKRVRAPGEFGEQRRQVVVITRPGLLLLGLGRLFRSGHASTAPADDFTRSMCDLGNSIPPSG